MVSGPGPFSGGVGGVSFSPAPVDESTATVELAGEAGVVAMAGDVLRVDVDLDDEEEVAMPWGWPR
ncbi:MAG TPA: hypothetical protein VE261_06435 [Gaiellaceae bacterium]|jgi:hypothetical protein|nr:hypothetical protein [Gaiellaceae bacterium]